MSFARGLSEDYEAVMNTRRDEWSNGQLEGQVNRLKLIKRQMYGRAKFDLLRAVKRVKPKSHVFGHIHKGYGAARRSRTAFVNACICDAAYRPINEPGHYLRREVKRISIQSLKGLISHKTLSNIL